MSGGWIPMPADLWPLMVERLQAAGEPWPEQACLFDLRWLYDQRGSVPGRRALRQRWGVTDRIARRLLASSDRWWDPMKGPTPTTRPPRASRERPAGVPPVSRERPADVPRQDGPTPDTGAKCPAGVPPVSRRCPADVHRRVDPPSPSPSQSPPPKPPAQAGGVARPADADLVEACREVLAASGASSAVLAACARGDTETARDVRAALRRSRRYPAGTRLRELAAALQEAVREPLPTPAPQAEAQARDRPPPELHAATAWARLRPRLVEAYGETEAAIWTGPLVPVGLSEGVITLSAPSSEWLDAVAEGLPGLGELLAEAGLRLVLVAEDEEAA